MKERSTFGSSSDRPMDLNIASTPSARVGPGSTANPRISARSADLVKP